MSKRSIEDGEKAHLELKLLLYQQGLNLGAVDTAKLIKAGLIKDPNEAEPVTLQNGEQVRLSLNKYQRAGIITDPKQEQADSQVSVVYVKEGDDPLFTKRERVVTERLFKQQIESAAKFSGSYKEITEEMWRPASKVKHTEDFIAWIDSINRPDGFWNSIHYKPYELYCQQAEQWLREQPPEFNSDEDIFEYRIRENQRCKENSLYALDKYGELKEANKSGTHKYVSAKVHKVLLYLLDCDYSFNLVKCRQMAATSTIALWILVKAMFNFNLSTNFISQDKIKAEDTLENKIKYGFSKFPKWLKPESRNDRMQRIVFGEQTGKGERDGNNSGISVLPPGKTAVASGTPDKLIIDETGNIEELNAIITDDIPTMHGLNPETQQLELLRQVIMLGTGGEMEKAGIVLKTVYMSHLEMWKKRRFNIGIVPLYFNVWWRMGMTREYYEEMKELAYAAEGPTAAADKIKFHQNFPITLEDVFLQGGKTLIGMEEIQKHENRIADLGLIPDYGYFEPVYDTTQPATEGSDVPYKITGATFVPCSIGNQRNTTIIFQHPKKWMNRYYKGTDPIASDSGHSKLSSSIWDAHYSCPCAVVNYRTDNYRECFLQSLLLGIYYHHEEGHAVPEVLEANIGLAYREYIENKGYGTSLVYSTELPDNLRAKTGVIQVTIDNKGLRNTTIIDILRSIFETYSDRIMITLYFTQLRTFVLKQKGAGQTWEPLDKRYNWDDALFGLVYAYICAQCYSGKKPVNLEGESSPTRNKHIEYKPVHIDGQLRMVPKKEYERIKNKNGSVLSR